MTLTTEELVEKKEDVQATPEVESELEYESDEDQLLQEEEHSKSEHDNEIEGNFYDTNNDFNAGDNRYYKGGNYDDGNFNSGELDGENDSDDDFYHRDDEPGQILTEEEEYIVEEYAGNDQGTREAGNEEEFDNGPSEGYVEEKEERDTEGHDEGESVSTLHNQFDTSNVHESHSEIDDELQNEFLSSDEEATNDLIDDPNENNNENKDENNNNDNNEGTSNDYLSEIPVYLDIGNGVVKLFPPHCYEDSMFSELPLLFNNTNIIDQPLSEIFDTFKLVTSTLDDVVIFKIPALSNLTIRSDSIECRSITLASILEIFDILRQQDEETYKFVQIEVSKEIGLSSHLKSMREGAISKAVNLNSTVKRSLSDVGQEEEDNSNKRIKEEVPLS